MFASHHANLLLINHFANQLQLLYEKECLIKFFEGMYLSELLKQRSDDKIFFNLWFILVSCHLKNFV